MLGSIGAKNGAKIAIRIRRINIARKGETDNGSFFDHLMNVLVDEVRDVMNDLPCECVDR
ncbi:hypothetical protein D3C71_2214280 [compost metagenome]